MKQPNQAYPVMTAAAITSQRKQVKGRVPSTQLQLMPQNETSLSRSHFKAGYQQKIAKNHA